MIDYFYSLVTGLVSILLSPTSRFFLPYLYITALFALAVLYRRTGSIEDAFRALIRSDVFLHRSSINDYKLALGNYLLLATVLAYGILNSATLGEEVTHFLHFAFGDGPQWHPGFFGAAAVSFVFLLAYDGGNFAQHWLQHKIPVLWELHKVHHSAEVMTPVTAIRVHPLSQLISSSFLAILFGLLNGVFLYLYAGKIAFLTVLGVNIFLVLHYTLGVYHLQHSHIWLSFPPVLRSIFASPSMHMIHHSKDPKHYGKNFGFVLTVWDRLAGTLHIPDDDEQYGLVLGIAEDEQVEMQTVRQLYVTPLRRVVSMLIRPKTSANQLALPPLTDHRHPK